VVFGFVEAATPIRLEVARADGGVVAVLELAPGKTRLAWDASGAPPGLYFYAIRRSEPGTGVEVGAFTVL
jgi:hypothetical protein